MVYNTPFKYIKITENWKVVAVFLIISFLISKRSKKLKGEFIKINHQKKSSSTIYPSKIYNTSIGTQRCTGYS